MGKKKPGFEIQVEPISEVVDMALNRIDGVGMVGATCAGMQCDSCPLSIYVNGGCGFIYASKGHRKLLTKTQKEILACIAIFGRYPLED